MCFNTKGNNGLYFLALMPIFIIGFLIMSGINYNNNDTIKTEGKITNIIKLNHTNNDTVYPLYIVEINNGKTIIKFFDADNILSDITLGLDYEITYKTEHDFYRLISVEAIQPAPTVDYTLLIIFILLGMFLVLIGWLVSSWGLGF